jgi:hypothetical protein
MLQGKLLDRYTGILKRIMPLSIPALTDGEIDEAIQYSIMKRFKDSDCTIHNNYKHKTVNTSIAQLTEYILDKEPIMTSYGCLFTKHGKVKNPLYDLIEEIVTIRDKFKHEMFKYKKGTEEYEKYFLLQLLAKVDANALYGCLGNYSSMFYNIYVATSITRQGKSAISASIMLFEGLLANNVKFGSLNEIITFIDNTVSEERIYDDRQILDREVSLAEAYCKVMGTCGYNWIPDRKDANLVWDIMTRLTPQDLTRLYYKNNMYAFFNNSFINNLLMKILCTLKLPFLDPNKPPKEIKNDLNQLIEYIKEYVYYGYQIIDKLDRVETMTRDVVLVTDTDSCIISLEPWYRFVLDKTKYFSSDQMNIKNEIIDIIEYMKMDSFGDRELLPIVERVDPSYDYDFYDETLIEQQRLINPVNVIPQDGLRHSIINIMSYCVSQLILDYMYKYTINHNSAAPSRKCLLIMKNEFLFKTILLTDGKKNYAAIQEIQEGNLIPKGIDTQLAISGLPIDKVGIPESTGKELKRILYEDILNSGDIDQIQTLKDIAILERKIFNSIENGETKYHKPARIKSLSTYDTPFRIQGIKASVAYNALKDEHEDPIDLSRRNSILIIKVNISQKIIEGLKESNPNKYEQMTNLLATKEFKGSVEAIGIPSNASIPSWVIEFIDYNTIIHDNLTNFPLESIGITRLNNKNITYSNILEL